MKPRHAVLLVLTSALALGCASANAQDGQGNPQPPEPQPGAADRPAPAGKPERPDPLQHHKEMEEMHERMRAAEARLTDAKARLDQLVQVEKKGADEASVREAKAQVESAAAELEKFRTHFAHAAPRGPGAPGGPGGAGGFGGGMAGPRDGGPREFRWRLGGPEGPDGRGGGFGGGPMGPGPSVEQRLEMLERAVHEMHEMFERHHVGMEMRRHAEEEMRARALGGPDTRPMQPPAPMGPGAAPPPVPPRPPMARFDVQVGALQWDDARAAEVRAAMQAQTEEMRKQMETAHHRIEELSRQLADTQAALKKAQEELETLRAKK